MGLYALAMSILQERVFASTKAEHNTKNIHYAYQLATKKRFDKIELASYSF